MEPDDGGDEFPDGASPAALQRILRKLGAGLDLLSPSGALESTINTLSINRTLLRTFFHAGHPRMKQLLGDLKADGDDERQVPSRSLNEPAPNRPVREKSIATPTRAYAQFCCCAGMAWPR